MIGEPNCAKRNCKHLQGVKQADGTEMTEVVYCTAFPDGIPDDIAYGTNLHMEVHPDQENEIIFETA